MHYGTKNPRFKYLMKINELERHFFTVSLSERDLGVILCNNLRSYSDGCLMKDIRLLEGTVLSRKMAQGH